MIHQLRKLKSDIIRIKYRNRKGFRKNGFETPFSSMEISNQLLLESLGSSNPLMIARHGSVELCHVTNPSRKTFKNLCGIAGFFPADPELGQRFRREYLEANRSMDILGVWNYRHTRFSQEEDLFRQTRTSCRLVDLSSLSPFHFDMPWSRQLAGKNVLVIHPFERTIRRQYARREHLFKNQDVLPEFQKLETLRAVQSIGGKSDEFNTWFDALDHMKTRMEGCDFDVALIGCGAYGFLLAEHAKKLGKQGIHIGGALQLWFGIKGKRWEEPGYEYDKRFYNEHWVRPDEQERPVNAETFENACYW